MMKKLIYFCVILLLTTCVFLNYYNYKSNFTEKMICNNIILSKKIIDSTNKSNTYISLMYTNKCNGDYVANYGIYDVHLNEFKTIYSRINHHYSDFAIDNKNNNIYYSDLIEKKYNIYKVNLNKKDYNPLKMLNDNINGDIFNLYKNKIVFRTFDKAYQNQTIGTYDLMNGKVKIWDNGDKESTVYNFYCNSFNSKIYSVERSLKEMYTKSFPNIPKHRIIQYNENGIKEKDVYSSDKFINNISVDNGGNKILFDATNIEGNKVINKIYLIDLNTLKEEIMITPKEKFGKYTFTRMKMPQFSPDEKGFYFLGSTSGSTVIEYVQGSISTTVNAIYYYEFSTKNIYKVFEVPNAFINIYKIM